MCKKKDALEDEALKLAADNIKMAENLEGDLQIYQETVHPHFEEQSEKATELMEQVAVKQ